MVNPEKKSKPNSTLEDQKNLSVSKLSASSESCPQDVTNQAEWLNLALDAGGLALWEVNLVTNEIIDSPRLRSLFGIRDEPVKYLDDWMAFILPEDRIVMLNSIAESVKGHDYNIQYRVRRTDGMVIWLASRGRVIADAAGKPTRLIGVSYDITQMKLAEKNLYDLNRELEERVKERTAALTKSEEKYRLLVENASEAVIVIQDHSLKFFNKKMLELTGYSQEELAFGNFFDMVYSDDREMVYTRYEKRRRGEIVPGTYAFRISQKDGNLKWVEVNAVLINWEGQPATLGMLTDITHRKLLEQDLKIYAHKITQVQEEERKRIARELHDDTAQYLSILDVQINALIDSNKIGSPEIIEKLKFLEKDARRALEDVRRYSHELRPAVLENLGLQAALVQIAEDTNKLGEMLVKISSEGTEPLLAEEVKLAFFRIAQEALNNSRKHARASRVDIKLEFKEHQLVMLIDDDGAGFDFRDALQRSIRQGSLGLTSMQERAHLIGADLHIESQLGRGTRVKVSLVL